MKDHEGGDDAGLPTLKNLRAVFRDVQKILKIGPLSLLVRSVSQKYLQMSVQVSGRQVTCASTGQFLKRP